MSTANINLNVLYFEYKVLTIILGEPTFRHIHNLFRELKAKTAAMPCTLGGRSNGYLRMVVSAAHYERMTPGTLFILPVIPAVLVVDPTGT